jgi:hypothetical protein
VRRLRLILAVAASVALMAPREAFACACCSNQSQRTVNVEALDHGKRVLLEELRFADSAKLYLGEADPDSVRGSPTHQRLMRSRPHGRETGSYSR